MHQMKNTLSKDKNMVEYSFKLKYTTDTGTASPWEIDWSRVMPLCIVMLVIHGLRARNISVHTGIRQLLITYIYHAKTGANQSASFSIAGQTLLSSHQDRQYDKPTKCTILHDFHVDKQSCSSMSKLPGSLGMEALFILRLLSGPIGMLSI